MFSQNVQLGKKLFKKRFLSNQIVILTLIVVMGLIHGYGAQKNETFNCTTMASTIEVYRSFLKNREKILEGLEKVSDYDIKHIFKVNSSMFNDIQTGTVNNNTDQIDDAKSNLSFHLNDTASSDELTNSGSTKVITSTREFISGIINIMEKIVQDYDRRRLTNQTTNVIDGNGHNRFLNSMIANIYKHNRFNENITWINQTDCNDIYKYVEEESVNTSPNYNNLTSCSQIVDSEEWDEQENFTVDILPDDSLILYMSFEVAYYQLHFRLIENVSESVYCMGASRYFVTGLMSNGATNQTLTIGFNSSIPNGLIEVNADCWNKGRDSACVTKAYISLTFLTLPIMMGMPDTDAFWNFSSSLFHLSYGWLKSIRTENMPVSWNSLRKLSNTSIEELSILDNIVPYVYPNVPYLPRLKLLDISSTTFVSLPIETLEMSPILEKLVMSNSQFSTDLHDIFELKLTHLKVLEMSNIRTKIHFRITPKLSNFASLEKLDLSRNKLTIQLPSFPLLVNLSYLNISYIQTNNFEYKSDAFNNLPSLEFLDISGNNLHHIPSNFVRNKNLTSLVLSYNNLNEMENLSFSNHNYTLLNISNNKLEKWPIFQSCTIQRLDISHNKLHKMENLSHNNTNIKYLDASKNNISSWTTPDIFKQKSNWSELNTDLESNETIYETWLKDLDVSSNYIQAVPDDMIKSLNSLQSINLIGNPFDCSDCSIPTFQNWLNSSRQTSIYDIKRLECFSPKIKAGLSIKYLNFYEEKCMLVGSSLYLYLGIPMIIILFLIICAVGTIYLYRFELFYIGHLLKLRNRKVEDQYGKSLYDAFICFSGNDRAWVMNHLAPALERSTEEYRLCLHDRDFPLGSRIVHNIVHSIEKSRRTVIVLTDEFVSSKWCQWELEMANHRMFENSRNFLILLELEQMNRQSLPRHLKLLMDTRTYLEWPRENNDSRLEEQAIKRLKRALGPSIRQMACDLHNGRLRNGSVREADTEICV